MEETTLLIEKASGEMSPYSEEKLRYSLINAGARQEHIDKIVSVVNEHLYPGIPTKKIYRLAFNELRKATKPVAARYKLKRAIMELGPSGFPFERYIAEILRMQGHTVEIGQVVRGRCVKHEIDIIARKDNSYFLIECKYHNFQGTPCDVKIPLYVQARFKDVESVWKEEPLHATKFHQGWVVTNTRFTHDAIQYGTCAGLNLLGWNYPPDKNLKDLTDKLKLYPITCLTTLTKHEKRKLLEQSIILCKDLINHSVSLQKIGLKEERANFVINEARQLCDDYTITG